MVNARVRADPHEYRRVDKDSCVIAPSDQLADEERSLLREIETFATEPTDGAVLDVKCGAASNPGSGVGDSVHAAKAPVERQSAQHDGCAVHIHGDRIARCGGESRVISGG